MQTALVPEDQPSETSVYETEFVARGVDAGGEGLVPCGKTERYNLPDYTGHVEGPLVLRVGEGGDEAATRCVNLASAEQGQKGADKQDKYVINIKQTTKFVVGLGECVVPTDIEEGMRLG